MSKLTSFVESLEDFELSFLYYYRLEEYMHRSQEIIKKEIKKRKISNELMKKLIREKINVPFDPNNTSIQCSYCKSFHYHTKTSQHTEDRLANIYDALGAGRPVKYITSKTCSICGKPFTENNESFKKRTKMSID